MNNNENILYKEVVLKRDLIYGEDFSGEKIDNIKKGSIGTVVDIFDNEWCSVKFFEYKNSLVISVKFIDLEEDI